MISAKEITATISSALQEGLFTQNETAVVFYSLDRLDERLNSLQSASPESTTHFIAVKANPSVKILEQLRARGCGAEVASMGEIHLALEAGFPPSLIAFDSPAKTMSELEFALSMGLCINANCMEEIDRIAALLESIQSTSIIGIRINPETEYGKIESTSVAVSNSKFGVSLSANRNEILKAIHSYEWLQGLHVHIGSQGMAPEQLVEGIGIVYDFLMEIEDQNRIKVFNVGGGLPVKYKPEDRFESFDRYFEMLKNRCPHIFNPGIRIFTEFGRSIHADCAWVASKVEYRLQTSPIPTLVTHVGADMFLRKAYRPNDWHHEMGVWDGFGNLRDGEKMIMQVAGPLCFAGDYISRDVSLPADVSEGDFLVIRDVGAYTFGMWSLYNSREMPALIGYSVIRSTFKTLKSRQSLDNIVEFWR